MQKDIFVQFLMVIDPPNPLMIQRKIIHFRGGWPLRVVVFSVKSCSCVLFMGLLVCRVVYSVNM